jgi:hypothetical protein
MHIPI